MVNQNFAGLDFSLVVFVAILIYLIYLLATEGVGHKNNNIYSLIITLVAMFVNYLFRRYMITHPKFVY